MDTDDGTAKMPNTAVRGDGAALSISTASVSSHAIACLLVQATPDLLMSPGQVWPEQWYNGTLVRDGMLI